MHRTPQISYVRRRMGTQPDLLVALGLLRVPLLRGRLPRACYGSRGAQRRKAETRWDCPGVFSWPNPSPDCLAGELDMGGSVTSSPQFGVNARRSCGWVQLHGKVAGIFNLRDFCPISVACRFKATSLKALPIPHLAAHPFATTICD